MKIPIKLMAFKYYVQNNAKKFPHLIPEMEDIYYDLMLDVAKNNATDENIRKSYKSIEDLVNIYH